jgi:hypothetical protein
MRLALVPRAAADRWRGVVTGRAQRRKERRDQAIALRVQRASDPQTTRMSLARLIATSAWQPAVGRALAANPATPGRYLPRLARRQWDVAAEVARNPATPERVLKRLAVTARWAVQAAVATNPRTPPKALSFLSTTARLPVRVLVATNPSLPAGDVHRLLNDDNQYVRAVAAKHPSAAPDALAQIAAPMSEPAWVLRAVAANPACPTELSDQVLTWLALGGAGNSDPRFDPIDCTGHPGDTSTSLLSWYRDAARKPAAEAHPLWRVRAAVTTSLERIPIPVLTDLAQDPRPEVRRTAARFQELSWGRLKDLQQDADPSVRQLATVAAQSKRANPRPGSKSVRRRRLARGAIAVVVVGNLVRLVTGQVDGSASPASSSSTHIPNTVLGATDGDIVAAMGGTPTEHAALPGGASVVAGTLPESSGDYLTFTSGSMDLLITVPATVMSVTGSILDDGVELPPNGPNTTIFVATQSNSLVLSVRQRQSPDSVIHVHVSFGGTR